MRESGRTRACARGAALATLLAGPSLVWAQPAPVPTPHPLTFKSLGQPPLLKPYVAGSLTWTEKADFILAFTPYFRRGGLFGTGGNFRVEWIPGRGNSFNFGFQVPLAPPAYSVQPSR